MPMPQLKLSNLAYSATKELMASNVASNVASNDSDSRPNTESLSNAKDSTNVGYVCPNCKYVVYIHDTGQEVKSQEPCHACCIHNSGNVVHRALCKYNLRSTCPHAHAHKHQNQSSVRQIVQACRNRRTCRVDSGRGCLHDVVAFL